MTNLQRCANEAVARTGKGIEEQWFEEPLSAVGKWKREAEAKGFTNLLGLPGIIKQIHCQIEQLEQIRVQAKALNLTTEAVNRIDVWLKTHNVSRSSFWTAAILWCQGFPEEDLGFESEDDPVQIFYKDKEKVKKIEDRIFNMVCRYERKAVDAIPDEQADLRERQKGMIETSRTKRYQWWKGESNSEKN